MSSLPCNVVLLPNSAIAELAVSTSRQLAGSGTLFTLDNQRYFVHITLYMLQLKDDDIPRVVELLKDFASQTAAFELQATKYSNEERFVDVEYARTDELVTLQNRLLAALNPIRDGMRAKDAARIAAATGEARVNLEKYGYRGVRLLFRPHITLTRTEDEQKVATDQLLPLSRYDGTFPKIGLFEMGDNGTCIREITSIELEQQ